MNQEIITVMLPPHGAHPSSLQRGVTSYPFFHTAWRGIAGCLLHYHFVASRPLNRCIVDVLPHHHESSSAPLYHCVVVNRRLHRDVRSYPSALLWTSELIQHSLCCPEPSLCIAAMSELTQHSPCHLEPSLCIAAMLEPTKHLQQRPELPLCIAMTSEPTQHPP